jgi:outer membrane receptor protein involved in Fe transport
MNRSTVLALLLVGVMPLPQAATANAGTPDEDVLEEVVVSGTHIRGAVAAGSNPITITREQIDASGYGRIQDVLATVTQNVNRTNAAVQDGAEANNYFDRGAEVQLRGLGVGTTLVLVNGQRQAESGYQGSFTDISTIPVMAIERIEILPEGASALYGSDAIGGIVNIVLRQDFDGEELRVRASTAGGDATERTAAALWGRTSTSGHLMLGVDYDDSHSLACAARARCAVDGDFRSLGGSDLRAPGGNPGTIVDPAFGAIPHGQDGRNLTAASLVPGTANYNDVGPYTDILPIQHMRSAIFSAGRDLLQHWQLSVDGRYSDREFTSAFPQAPHQYSVPAANPLNHFGRPVVVAYDLTPDLGPVVDRGKATATFVSTGIRGEIPRRWQLRASASYSRATTSYTESNTLNLDAVEAALGSADPSNVLNMFGDGAHSSRSVVTALRRQADLYAALNEFTTATGTLAADGPVYASAAGPIRIAMGAEARREHSIGLNIADQPEDRWRDLTAVYAEIALPVMAARAGSDVDRMDMSVASRYDHYSDAGGSFNPRVGITWRPLRAMTLRGSWGTSFRAPPFIWSNPDQIGDAYVYDVADPKSPTGATSRALLLIGASRNLKPETSTSWSMGADMAPSALPGLTLSATYFDIDYKNKIRNVGVDSQEFLTQESQLAALITRNPTPAQLAATCSNIVRFVPFSIGDCNDSIKVIIDARFRNLARTRTRGIDADVRYARATTLGRLDASVGGTYTFAEDEQITPGSSSFDVIDTVGNPLKVRVQVRLAWSLGSWKVQGAVYHTGAYRDTAAVPIRSVGSWTTVDLNVGFRREGGNGWLAGMQCNLALINLFDRPPPFVNRFDMPSGALGYDPVNASLVGRQLSLQIAKHLGR